ncbi:zinc finger protein 135-like [Sander lucioperca]|uniref:zinc finger protein 135-like n=1 Tax=Sander lucioperca TaxID=283035 RepID=UPI00165353F1|nr:zinc finger protein 135-like [Sander lucioperca]
MSKVQMLRASVEQRLTAAAEEIFGLFEGTIAEYEEELCRSKEKNERQQKLLDAVLNPQLRLHRADVQQLSVVKAEVPPEQQEWSSSLDQEDPEPPPHIKEEQEELWTSQEGEQRQGLEEADIKFPLTSVPVKSEEDDEEKAQSSQLHGSQTEENREAKRTGADGEDCGGPEPARNSDPDSPLQPATHDKTSDSSESQTVSGDLEETREPQSGLNPLKNNEVAVSDVECNTGNTSVSSSECAGSFGHKKPLQKHSGVQTGGKTYCCSVCSKGFSYPCSLKQHLTVHTGEKSFSCSVCDRRFALKQHLTRHLASHTKEKSFSCSVCDKRFAQKHYLNRHLASHTGEKSFSCSVCDKRFAQSKNLKRHMAVHTRKKPLSCSVCGKGFSLKKALTNHMKLHSEGKMFNCSVCKTGFSSKSNLTRHMRIHTGEKPFSCSVCDRRFSQLSHVKSHKCVGESSRKK